MNRDHSPMSDQKAAGVSASSASTTASTREKAYAGPRIDTHRAGELKAVLSGVNASTGFSAI